MFLYYYKILLSYIMKFYSLKKTFCNYYTSPNPILVIFQSTTLQNPKYGTPKVCLVGRQVNGIGILDGFLVKRV